MKTDNDLKLLDALLADKDWASCSAQIHNAGLASLRTRKKARARIAFAGQLMLGILGTALCWWLVLAKHTRAEPNQLAFSTASNQTRPHGASTAPIAADAHYITEEQMLKMFPEGSCLIAEVNGEKQLVFLEKQ
jgi:hypothetical protein